MNLRNLDNISPEDLHLIDQYLAEELSPETRTLFETRLASEPLLVEQVKELKLLRIGIQEQAISQRLTDFHQQLTTTKKPAAPAVALWKRLAVAAAVLAAVLIPFLLLKDDKSGTEKLYASYFTPDPGLVTAMGNTSNYNFEKAMVDYKEQQYDSAITAWSALLAQNPQSDTLQYFLGAAYQAKRDNKTAITYLEKIIKLPASVFYRDACWYLGLALLKEKQTARAIEFLRLSNHTGSTELIEAINSK